jgi:uncharacterized membrane protein YhhN
MQAILNIGYPLAAMTYLLSARWLPYPGHPLVKAVPILLLAAVVLSRAKRSRPKLLFGIGLLFAAGGDIVLATRIPLYFVTGLGLFFVAHIFYATSFYRRPRVGFCKRKLRLGLVLCVVVTVAVLVLPRAGTLLVPVAAYMLAISTMGVLAAVQREDGCMLYAGAVLFIVSDSIIAVNKLVAPVPHAGMLIMCTYYLAQVLLARGILGISRR